MNRLLARRDGGQRNGAAAIRVGGEMDSVGKTGTTSDNRDYWFVGLTPYYVTATWYGYDSGFALNTSAGTSAPIRAWRWVMRRAQSGLRGKGLPHCTGRGAGQLLHRDGLSGLAGLPVCQNRVLQG